MDSYYQTCAIPKPEPRKRTKGRKRRAKVKEVADVRAYVFARERDLCRCCRRRRAESMHEIRGRRLAKVSKRNSIAVCGRLVGVEPSCHTYLQAHEIEVEHAERGAEGLLVFVPKTPRACEWMKVKWFESLASPVMRDTEVEW